MAPMPVIADLAGSDSERQEHIVAVLVEAFEELIERLDDPWVDDATSRVWIQGDLHAENYGTYMDSAGVLVFDVNDFDEAYLGHFTWDLRRMAGSLALLG